MLFVIKTLFKIKGKLYCTTIRPTISFGTECWAVKSQQKNKLDVVEIKMLCWISGSIRQNRIRNDILEKKLG